VWAKNIIIDKISIGKETISFSTKFNSLDSIFNFVSSSVNSRIDKTDTFLLNNNFDEFCINADLSGDSIYITTFNNLSEYDGSMLYSFDKYGYQTAPINNIDYTDFTNTIDSAIIISDLTKNYIQTIYFDSIKALQEVDISDIQTRAILSGDYSLVDKHIFNKYRKYLPEKPMVSFTNPLSTLTGAPSVSAGINLIEAISPKFLLSGMPYNYMFEIPINTDLTVKNCYTGTIKLLAGELKNHYDFWFDISGQIDITNNEIPIGSAKLKNTRIYISVNCTENSMIDNIVYLIYKFGNNYSNIESISINPDYSNIYHTSATIIPVSAEDSYIYPNSAYMYEHLEVIYGVNQIGYEGLHKSALFSIKINNSNLVSGINNLTAESIEIIKKTIEEIIKTGIKKIIPPYTQLFKIIWNK